MDSYAHAQLLRLKSGLTGLGAEVRTSLDQALQVLREPDHGLAQVVIDGDGRINQMEVSLEEQCQEYLALLQPVAVDLRTVISVMRITADLERIADQAGNIAKHVQLVLRSTFPAPIPADLIEAGRLVQLMLRTVLDAWETLDTDAARRVVQMDRQVDDIYRRAHQQVENNVQRQTDRLVETIACLKISRELERIGDHCVNIAENIFYLIRGQIVRHITLP